MTLQELPMVEPKGQAKLLHFKVFVSTNVRWSIRKCDEPTVCECFALSICCNFSYKAWSVFSLFIIINTKEISKSTLWGCWINACLLIYMNNKKIWRCSVTFNFEDMVHMLHFFKKLTSWSCFVLHLQIGLR